MSLNEMFDRLLPLIEDELLEVVQSPHHSHATYYGMMRYHLGWLDENLAPIRSNSGKRVRPIICLLACEAAGGDASQALPAAAALELIHNFSLVHDDIQDASRYRRGRRAVWDIWGEAHAINVGDGLFVLARTAMYRLSKLGLSPARQQQAMQALDRACLSLCEGQFSDMTFEDRLDVDLDQYLWMIRHKTAALLAASAQVGAIVATEDASLADCFYRFGENLGMAFQIEDDILGVWGDEKVTGKSAATDIRSKKKALPALYALTQTADGTAARELAMIYGQQGPLEDASIQTVLDILERVGARTYAEQMARSYYQQAVDSLAQSACDNAAARILGELAASLLGRQA